MQDPLRDLDALRENAPDLLKRAPIGQLQARGVLPEAVLRFRDLPEAFPSTPPEASWPDHPFTGARVVLLDAEDKWAGSMAFSKIDEGGQWDYLADRGCVDLVEALRAAEDFSNELGQVFESRILVVQDLMLQVLLLVPEEPGAQTFVLPLPPTFGHLPDGGPPLTYERFRELVTIAWETNRPRPVDD